jgi:hypothetical protein
MISTRSSEKNENRSILFGFVPPSDLSKTMETVLLGKPPCDIAQFWVKKLSSDQCELLSPGFFHGLINYKDTKP